MTILQLDEHTSIAIPAGTGGPDEAPITVEEKRVIDPRAPTTTHVKIVRQGDRILSVVRGATHHSDTNWPEMPELFED